MTIRLQQLKNTHMSRSHVSRRQTQQIHCLPWFLSLFILSLHIFPSHALLVRSEGSGGIATGMTLEGPSSSMVVIAGTTFEKEFWGMSPTTEGECFVVLGDVGQLELPASFLKRSLPRPAMCFGGTHDVIPSSLSSSSSTTISESNFGMASLIGMHLDESQTGFVHKFEHSTGIFQEISMPIDLPSNLIPVTSTSSSDDVFLGLHQIDQTPFQNSRDTPLETLLNFWWTFTSPMQVHQSIQNNDAPSLTTTITAKANTPRIRKQNMFTGEFAFDVELQAPQEGRTTLVSGIALVELDNNGAGDSSDSLLVIGSTNSAETSDSLFGTTNSKDTTDMSVVDWDGYILFLNSDSGMVAKTSDDLLRPAIRINSITNGDDFIEGICTSPDKKQLYVVGSTTGKMMQGVKNGGAFVIQYDLETLQRGWVYQISGEKVQGLMCTADDDGNVYMGGVTESDLWESPGKNSPTFSPDAFVIKILDGTAQWIQPLDTTIFEDGEYRREWIAGMEITNQGNLLVLLNSMSFETGENEVFLVDLHPEMGENDLFESLNYADVAIPTFKSLGKKEKKQEKEVKIAAITVPILAALLVFALTWWRCRRSEIETLPEGSAHEAKQKEEVMSQRMTDKERTGIL